MNFIVAVWRGKAGVLEDEFVRRGGPGFQLDSGGVTVVVLPRGEMNPRF